MFVGNLANDQPTGFVCCSSRNLYPLGVIPELLRSKEVNAVLILVSCAFVAIKFELQSCPPSKNKKYTFST